MPVPVPTNPEELLRRADAAAARSAFPIPADPEALLSRTDTAAALTAAGFPTSPATLATKATRGGGPPFQKYGSRPLYRWGASLAWAQGRLSKPRRSTSEVDAMSTDDRNAVFGDARRKECAPDARPTVLEVAAK
jgi:hypothetical protein